MLEINQSKQVAFLLALREHTLSEHDESMFIAEIEIVRDFYRDRVNLLRYFNDLKNDISDIKAYRSVKQSIDRTIDCLIDFFAIELIVITDDFDYRQSQSE